MTWPGRTVEFPAGGRALLVEVPPDADGDELLAALGLPAPRGTVVLNGTTAGIHSQLAAMVGGAGLAGAASRERLTLLTGGTDAGIFSALGGAMTEGSAPLVGVAPRRLVTWLGAAGRDLVPLEAHHTHFVLVEGGAWGDETPALLALAGALARRAPSVAVICGGGPVTREEARGHARAGRPLVVVAGSGRVADEVASAVGGREDAADSVTAEIVARGRIVLCPLAAGPGGLVDAVLTALGV